ncbi:MAG TPA: helix-turn-helix transcriptional regulator [Bordetella sp.]|jgi:transcriptional regulator with XRE-family HTH domain|nr:helix-turn-helix transcriptional regulator [Bordetella sp.]
MKKKLDPTFEAAAALARIGQNLRTARLRRSETEAALADRVGVSRSTIVRLEKGDGGVSAALLFEVLLQFGFSDQLFALADPEQDKVGQRLDAIRRPNRGSQKAPHIRRVDPSKL